MELASCKAPSGHDLTHLRLRFVEAEDSPLTSTLRSFFIYEHAETSVGCVEVMKMYARVGGVGRLIKPALRTRYGATLQQNQRGTNYGS